MSRKRGLKTKDWSRFKIIFMGLVFIGLWMGLWARAYWVQIVEGPKLARLAENQYWCREKIQGKRGEIFDRNGLVLAQSVLSKSVYANPLEINDYKLASKKLSKILNIKRTKLVRILRQKKSFVWLTRKISDRKAKLIRRANLKGIYLVNEYKRVYPQGHLLGQVLGFVGTDGHGLEGLERFFDGYLGGTEKKIVLLKDAAGRRMAPGSASATLQTLSGHDLYLTIDARVQLAAEDALAEAVQRFSGRSGVCVVVHVPSGEILALASYPFFNPNNFRNSSPSIWRNRAILDLLEPGSTIKPFLVAAALTEGVCTKKSIYFCENGRWRIGNSEINDTHKYGWLSVNRIIRYSSNIGAAKIGLDLGEETYFNYLQRLGFGRAVELPFPGRSKGLIRPYHKWNKIDLAAASFGQGLAITPLHLAQAYLCLAKEGVFEPLKLVSRPKQEKLSGYRVFPKKVARLVLSMLREVVEEDGTGKQGRISGIEVGGKTGTAQKAMKTGGYGDKYVASFVSLFPALNPKYLVLVIVDEPHPQHYGGVVAAPAAKKVGMELLSLYNDYPKVQPVERDKQRHELVRVKVKSEGNVIKTAGAVDAANVPDFQGVSLRKALQTLLELGIVPELIGQGMVVKKQKPRPGSKWPADKSIKLWLTEPELSS
ncbi:PASTA domain-containing protein [Desulfohalobiaceae bacterium Ax17]|uniref:penicillin-binding transpeptidase domain-containing protein n=1 Tax=Desulfovulcanus ferrireducens TaxID=2831190 RepID=UPI00207BADA2|nr:penicillin-binding transpeptidase domain-containing protein [Desulfovulcanus ferrireducens]MBT8762739.1 PASTA domain-containing protein [Desulfovulcanus ferrireducens]